LNKANVDSKFLTFGGYSDISRFDVDFSV